MKKVKKILRGVLRNSWSELARSMAGKGPDFEFKYLTQDQVDMLLRDEKVSPNNILDLNGIDLTYLKNQEINDALKNRNKLNEQKKLIDSKRKRLIYKDEDGLTSVEFESQSELDEFITINKSRTASGEKFEVESIEDIKEENE